MDRYAVFNILLCMCTNILVVNRAWQAKLHFPVKGDSHKVEEYSCLWLLLTEEDKEAFSGHLPLFLQYWGEKNQNLLDVFRPIMSMEQVNTSRNHMVAIPSFMGTLL